MSDEDRLKWDERYRAAPAELSPPAALVRDTLPLLPKRGRALDVAGGSGRNAVPLAKHGLDVTIADISSVGLERAQAFSREQGVTIKTALVDFDCSAFPAGPWDVIVSSSFLWRPLFECARRELAPGGWLVFVQPTERNLERHPRPPKGYLLGDGEAPSLADGLEIVRYEEGWLGDGRHDAWLVARKPLKR